MTELEQVVKGLEILAKYDDTQGDVSMDYNRILYAGPQEEEALNAMSDIDRVELKSMYWAFSQDIGRWCWTS